MVLQAMANVFEIALIDFPSSFSVKIACFSPINSSLVGYTFLTINAVCKGKNAKLKLRDDIQCYLLFE